jgi:hypothetical protein
VNKSAFLLAVLWAAGSTGFVFARETLATEKITPDVSAMEENHPMIFELRDRIQNQRERIDQGVTGNTITMEVATSFRGVLKSVEKQMKEDYQANGPKKSMELTSEQYSALNAKLDENSKIIHEMKRTFYYYDSYFDHYNSQFPVSDTKNTGISEAEKDHPMIFELRDRIQHQRERVDQGVKDRTITVDQAANCREVLRTLEGKMKADYKANGSQQRMKLTKEQYLAFNTKLDTNSIVIHEGKLFFYYYGPYYDQYWF